MNSMVSTRAENYDRDHPDILEITVAFPSLQTSVILIAHIEELVSSGVQLIADVLGLDPETIYFSMAGKPVNTKCSYRTAGFFNTTRVLAALHSVAKVRISSRGVDLERKQPFGFNCEIELKRTGVSYPIVLVDCPSVRWNITITTPVGAKPYGVVLLKDDKVYGDAFVALERYQKTDNTIQLLPGSYILRGTRPSAEWTIPITVISPQTQMVEANPSESKTATALAAVSAAASMILPSAAAEVPAAKFQTYEQYYSIDKLERTDMLGIGTIDSGMDPEPVE